MVQQVLSTDGLLAMQAGGRPASTSIRRCSSTPSDWRPPPGRPEAHGLGELKRYITFGASPRASINLILTARALAFVRGRDYALPEDVLDMALDVLRHRLVLSFEALSDDVTSDALLKTILDRIPVPVVPLREHGNVHVSA